MVLYKLLFVTRILIIYLISYISTLLISYLSNLSVGIFAFTSFRSRDLMPRDSASPK